MSPYQNDLISFCSKKEKRNETDSIRVWALSICMHDLEAGPHLSSFLIIYVVVCTLMHIQSSQQVDKKNIWINST